MEPKRKRNAENGNDFHVITVVALAHPPKTNGPGRLVCTEAANKYGKANAKY